MRTLILLLIRGYQYFLSPWLGSRCRFHPSCSCYATEAIQRYGIGRGLFFAVWRILRCNPWSAGGHDPVP